MANTESTAINRLVHIAGGRVARNEDDEQTRRVDPAVRAAVLRNARAYEAGRRARVEERPPLTFAQELRLIARHYTLQVGGAAVLFAIAIIYLVGLVVDARTSQVAAALPAPTEVTARPRSALLELPASLPTSAIVTPIDVAMESGASHDPAVLEAKSVEK